MKDFWYRENFETLVFEICGRVARGMKVPEDSDQMNELYDDLLGVLVEKHFLVDYRSYN